MGTKKWQLEEKDKKIARLEEKVRVLTEAIDQSIEYIDRLDITKLLKRAKSKVKTIDDSDAGTSI